MGYSYCTYTMTTIRYGTNEIKEYSIKGEVFNTLVLDRWNIGRSLQRASEMPVGLEGDDYSLEDDLAAYRNKTFCKDGVWVCSGGVKRDYEYICQQQNIPFNTVLDVTMTLGGHYY